MDILRAYALKGSLRHHRQTMRHQMALCQIVWCELFKKHGRLSPENIMLRIELSLCGETSA